MENKIKLITELNKKHSEMFQSQRLERELYLAKHPTNVIVFKCMDGRIHMPTVTQTPLGIMHPFRNIGGKFDLGWPLLNESFDRYVKKAVAKGNRTLVLVTYHYSEGDQHRGCAGFHYDCEESKRFTEEFRKQILRTYGENNGVVFPILVGLETDKDALIFHGENGQIMDVATIKDSDEKNLKTLFGKLYPSMPERILSDLIPLVQGNMRCIKQTTNTGKPLKQMVHGEWILAVGKGFDWLHTPNIAMIVGPYDPNIGEPIQTAANIIKSNMNAKSGQKEFVLLSSAVYSDAAEISRAKERTLYLNRLTQDIIKKNLPDMVGKMHSMAVILNADTMEMHIVK
ncbi:MAG: hypothetical protein UR69_C0002G0295 [Candidatus Moranbacteria bacterium GW2011_GWE2_35_2-]|nr:MAG: hypothetical protein UR69_C0002G0295 [Candidatus Moranbacteria bacterium GW2011_GWE2_35_2-]KKQ04823.1 MAG: hypothetical protein US15_C0042G0004 [Candidatus Moranbacteria bacterium GW2011_GWF1_36_4]KKQ21894.1 MAG: hypothetical protein US37_C0006G0022 [Candidatus Moranbacteria bacterium GW2011_GWF2_37_11]KKQ29426.1 MAG: hypothetical protein US44_C0001G0018 [Candidatus Moranbacteria bacterium GW2011_GWD1_37_17]KKQ30705.1 MAG: hypothetical protein US47_C0002G0295 [Candidatus Moranbacteria b